MSGILLAERLKTRDGGPADPSFNGVTVTGASQCTNTEVGYTLNVALFGLGGVSGQVVIESLAGSLIMNAIAAGFAGVSHAAIQLGVTFD